MTILEPTPPQPPDIRWWVAVNGTTQGPYEHGQLTEWLRTGHVTPESTVCPVGGTEWRRVRHWQAFADLLPPPPPAQIATRTAREPVIETQTRSRRPTVAAASPHLHQLAVWHRRFTIGILGILIGPIAILPLFFVPVVGVVAFIAMSVVKIWLAYGLANAMRSPTKVLWAVGTAIPCYLGEFVLVLLSLRATAMLQSAGVKVGLFGAKLPASRFDQH